MTFIQRNPPNGVQHQGRGFQPRRQMLVDLGRDLQSVYAHLSHQPLPENMTELLRRLDQRERGRS